MAGIIRLKYRSIRIFMKNKDVGYTKEKAYLV